MHPDSVYVVLSSTAQSWFDKLLPVLSALIGALAGGVLSYYSTKRQTILNYSAQASISFVAQKLDAYKKLADLASDGHGVAVKRGPREDAGAYPGAYESYESLKKWLNSLAEYLDRNRLFVDKSCVIAFEPLNQVVIQHLDQLTQGGQRDEALDEACRNLGRAQVAQVQGSTNSFILVLQDDLRKVSARPHQ